MAKPAILSTTYRGLAIIALGKIIGVIAPKLGLASVPTSEAIAFWVDWGLVAIGGAVAAYGRYRAGGIKGLLFDQEKKARRKSAKRVARATKV